MEISILILLKKLHLDGVAENNHHRIKISDKINNAIPALAVPVTASAVAQQMLF